MLLDFPPPKNKIYQRETVIAENFYAVVDLEMVKGWLKDFYDL